MPPKKTVPAKGVAKTQSKTATIPNKAGNKAKSTSTPAAQKKNATTAVKGKPVTNKNSPNVAKPKEKVWTKEDEAARKIQTKVRQFLGKKALQRKLKEKEEYEELMVKLEKEAFVQMVKMQQEEIDRQMKKEDEERKRKKEEAKRKKRMLEAAYDGDIDSIEAILQEVKDLDDKNNIGHDVIGKSIRNKHLQAMIECEDANENTPLSEAASGGHTETIKFLLDHEADPNTKGQFQRTPLYRAAFAGHLEPCQILLQNGADPRLYASDGQTPEQVASLPAIQVMLEGWDIAQTESLLHRIEAYKEKRQEENRQRREAEQNKLEGQIETAKKEYETKQKQLNTAYCELNKRILEHDLASASGFDRPELTLQAIHDAELDLEVIKMDTEKAKEKLSQARLKLREQQKQNVDGDLDDNLPGVKVMIRELDEVLMRDVGNKIKDSGKWPFIIDTSGQAAIFLRYRDTNMLNALRPVDMEPETIRMALLGAIRFGKPFIIDMMEVDMFDVCVDRFDEIQKGLMDALLDKSLLEGEKFISLTKETDGAEYQPTRHFMVDNFKFFFITSNSYPNDGLINRTYPIRIILPK